MQKCWIFEILYNFLLRTEEVEGLIQEIKSNDEKLVALNADIAVMKLLLGAPVEEAEQKTG